MINVDDEEVLKWEKEYKRENEKLRKQFLIDYPWFKDDDLASKDFYYNIGSDTDYLLKLLNLEINNEIFIKHVCKVKDLILDDCENFRHINKLEENGMVLITYQGQYWDAFMGQYSEEFNKGMIDDHTEITIYIFNEFVKKISNDVIDKVIGMIEKERGIYFYKEGSSFIGKYINQKMCEQIRKVPISNKNMLEKDLETIIIYNLGKIEDGMKLIKSQYEIDNGFIDILAKDANGVKCIIELKIVDDCKDIIFQSAYYPTQFNEKVRMITICPDYKPKILAALKNMGNVEIKKYYFQGLRDHIHFEDMK
jgi:hypothetical protein